MFRVVPTPHGVVGTRFDVIHLLSWSQVPIGRRKKRNLVPIRQIMEFTPEFRDTFLRFRVRITLTRSCMR